MGMVMEEGMEIEEEMEETNQQVEPIILVELTQVAIMVMGAGSQGDVGGTQGDLEGTQEDVRGGGTLGDGEDEESNGYLYLKALTIFWGFGSSPRRAYFP